MKPNPPQWALDAGLPAPDDDETFEQYVTRLGYNAAELTYGLTPRTMVLAHERLVHKLIGSLPDVWQKHLDEFVSDYARPRPTL